MVVRNSLFSAMCVAGLLGVVSVTSAHAGADLTIPNKDLVVGPGIVTFTGTATVSGPDLFNASSVIVVTNPGTFPAILGSGAVLGPVATPNVTTGTLNLASFDFTGFAPGIYSASIGFFDNLHPVGGAAAASASITVTIADIPEPGTVAFGVLAAGSVLGLIARKRKA